MPNHHSLHLGLNNVDPGHYQRIPVLRAAVTDAHDWARLAKDILGYQTQEALTEAQSTTAALLSRLEGLAGQLEAGDALLLTYSGHGGQVEDSLSAEPGDEDKDETWCLYDRQLLDDELRAAFANFRPGVRISVVADCCHSGTGIRAPGDNEPAEVIAAYNNRIALEAEMESAGFLPRRLSRDISSRIFAEFYELYRSILGKKNKVPRDVKASVQLFAACQDDQITYDGKANGIFTDVFKTLAYSGEWRGLNRPDALLARLQAAYKYPRPNYMTIGENPLAFAGAFPLLANLLPTAEQIAGAGPVPVAETKIATPAAADVRPAAPAYHKIRIEWPGGALTPALIAELSPVVPLNVEVKDGTTALVWFPADRFPSVWEPVHHLAREADRRQLPLAVEPVATPATPLQDRLDVSRESEDGYLPYWPPATEQLEPPTGWHLDDDHSQLASARDLVWDKMRRGELTENVRIGHLDTGWYPTHPAFAFNPNIRRDLTRSFVDKEKGINQAAIDLHYKNSEQQGHGSGTLGVLACWPLDPQFTGGQDLGCLGAVPFAEVVPIRIADSVLIFDTDNFCDGLEYAMEIGCEVVSMSMGGKPGGRMAKTINRAYDKGITIVTAAGNNMAKGLASVGPKTVVWPARFQRVLAACGACHNHIPYDFDVQERYGNRPKTSDYRYMQGNWGPAEAMKKALAAYSPNIHWVLRDGPQAIGKRGGGTSAATPQIAAAAAIWIALHKAELKKRGYAGTWKQVEAVREALFRSADKSFAESGKYYGNGILRARKALEYGVPDIGDDQRAEEASQSLWGLGETLTLFLHRRRAGDMPGPALHRSLELELQHLLLDDAEMAETGRVEPEDAEQIRQAVGRADYVSEALRTAMGA